MTKNTLHTNDHILVTMNSAIMTIQMNRPERKNALNIAMYEAMTAALLHAASDVSIRAVLIVGHESCFTSGNDLADFMNHSDLLADDNPIVNFMKALSQCPKPVVAAVNGVAVGIGTTLLMHCDLIYADSSAHFKLPFVNLGLCPEFAASLLLPRIAGYAKAAEWLLLGEGFNASAALTAGLLNDIVDDPKAYANDQCMKLAAQPPAALRSAKKLIKMPIQKNIDTAIRAEIDVFVASLQGAEFKEAVNAFFEKRSPDFSSFE